MASTTWAAETGPARKGDLKWARKEHQKIAGFPPLFQASTVLATAQSVTRFHAEVYGPRCNITTVKTRNGKNKLNEKGRPSSS